MSYNLNQCFLYNCTRKKDLALKLDVSLKDLMEFSRHPKYYSFDLTKKNGENRTIEYANKSLKDIHKKIHRYLMNVIRPDFIIGGVKGKSIIDNCKKHKENNHWLKFDITNFYDNCDRNYVYNFFLHDLSCSPDVAEILTNLTTLHGHLIQGYATSLDLSYFAFRKMFDELYNLSESYGLTFSTYVDDFTFSGSSNEYFKKLRRIVPKILNRYGHVVRVDKVKEYSSNSNKLITGLIVNKNQMIKVPNYRYLDVVNLLKKQDKDNFNSVAKELSYLNSLIGKINNIQLVEPDKLQNALSFLNKRKEKLKT